MDREKPTTIVLPPDTSILKKRQHKLSDGLGYTVRTFAQLSLPHSDPKTNYYSRTNGITKLTIKGDEEIGLPYGVMPRLILTWLCTQAVITQSSIINLAESQTKFLNRLGLVKTGRHAKVLQDQFKRLFSSSISIIQNDPKLWKISNIQIAKAGEIWVKSDSSRPVWGGSVTLSEDFFKEVIESPVPLNLEIMDKLKGSALAMDIYAWLSYRLFTLKLKGHFAVKIPWESLQAQFGSNYGQSVTDKLLTTEQIIKYETQARYNFKLKFIHQMKNVLLYYPEPKQYIQLETEFFVLKN